MPFLADGTDLQVNDGASSAFADITGVISITPPAAELGVYDTTHLNSTAGTMTKSPLSRAEPGQMSWVMWNDSTEYSRLTGLRGTAKSFKITYPNSTVDTFTGSITKVEQTELQNQEGSKLNVTVAVHGAVTRT